MLNNIKCFNVAITGNDCIIVNIIAHNFFYFFTITGYSSIIDDARKNAVS